MSVIKKSLSYSVTVVLLSTPVLVLWRHQNIYDWWRLRSYIAPSAVAALADQTTMNDKARKIFYVTRPELQAKSEFQKSCTIREQTIVLGCYQAGRGIFVYNVSDDRLSGVQQVTAAHEMLHAAYERLSSKEKAHVDSMTKSAYDNLHDDRLNKTVEAYRTRDASVVPNELHSILATEVRILNPELEQYYKRYFNNRKAIVDLSERFESEFTKRDAQIADYEEQLKNMKLTINELKSSLESQNSALDRITAELERLSAENNVKDYNANIPLYQGMIKKYNNDVAVLKKTIAMYNSVFDKLNAIIGEEQTLFNAIDTRIPATR